MNSLKRFGVFASLVVGLFVFQGTEARAQHGPSVSASIYGNNSGPVQGVGSAYSAYCVVDYFYMSLQGPSGTTEYADNSQSTYKYHIETIGFEYDSDYFLTVVACGSDDDGYNCNSDTKSFRTPPAPPGGGEDPPPGNGNGDCIQEPCPVVTSIDPEYGYLGQSGVMTITGSNLQNVNVITASPTTGMSFSIISTSETTVTAYYYISYSAYQQGYAIIVGDTLGNISGGGFHVY